MRKILITNDDGISADGIRRLAETAAKFGSVWVVAPDGQRSAVSHSLTLRRDFYAQRAEFPVENVTAYRCDGMPADCVRIGILNLVPGGPDVVLSGINYGYNVATDLQYSATVNAALEAAFLGTPAIAFSEEANPVHEATDRYLAEILEELLDKPLSDGSVWNVNFPGGPLSNCGEVLKDRSVSKHVFYRDAYLQEELSDGRIRFRLNGILQNEAEKGSDLRAVFDRCISVGKVRNIG